jgi:hypothetical protein
VRIALIRARFTQSQYAPDGSNRKYEGRKMIIKHLPPLPELGAQRDSQAIRSPQPDGRHIGHPHFWQMAMTRRQFLKASAAATAVAIGSGWAMPDFVQAAKPVGAAPNPIPGGTLLDGLGLFHFYFPTANPFGGLTVQSGQGDPSPITDLNGFIGVGDFAGGTGMGTTPSGTTPLFWAADVRFMKGEYVGINGKHRQGAFAFL